ncbi:hypothetical protein N1F89_10130 [Aquibium sp. A9E412]|uniref:PaaI family thioesterase n=1 Tax=Aquibium sp. A9E412 TaxID=2976767 RepID=UPI0025B08AD3|nr:hotdog domain-containing protein [Aquibium sp. A9E412]MDN2566579.1 hypothetical protein [Aquibium sp. A9E412]
MTAFTVEDARRTLTDVFAPWIVDLGLEPLGFDAAGGDFLLPQNPRLVHVGGVICGQATASAADTCAVVTLAALNGRFRVCTTVDLTTHFIRPLKPARWRSASRCCRTAGAWPIRASRCARRATTAPR